jgi:serine/threonine protein kinase/predicted ATPase
VIRQSLSADATSRFQLLGALGAGGSGAVYEAIDIRTGQRLALKELENTSAANIARFKQEFRALSGCHHPNLVALHELIEQNNRWLIVMELVPGSDLTEYIHGGPVSEDEPHSFDEGRLRSALSGIVEGLRALHGFGILHRDLKPSNVRVRPDGRAVLLDFGLATSVDALHQSTHAMAVGTVRYMAPEQAAGESVGTAADLYALGVCLFEALTGRAPFESNSAVAIMITKQQQPAPLASSFAPSIPPDLDQLCARLLAMDPAARPDAEEVLLVLGGHASGVLPFAPAPALPPIQEIFAGRERELEHLERALAGTHRGELRIVLVEGESGVGKSELVAEFLRRSAASHPKLLALRGRCYENEQVSYKAFDGCIDELSKWMRRMPDAESAALLPVRAALLGQLFPVLRNVRALAKAPRDSVAADPTARRLEAFDALAALLGKLAEERPLVLVVDDLQWADAESFRMLQALIEHAAPPPLLLLATIRPRDELEADVLAHVKAVREWKFTDVVSLFGLPRAQAKALAAKLLGPNAPDAWLEMIADESDGHPLFLSELVHFTQSHDPAARGRLTLEAALQARLERLDKRSRELLALVALAARPHGTHVFARAMSLPSIDEPARVLLAAKLLKARKGQELGCYHDRIRRTATELLGGARSVALHRQLALALADAKEVDPAEQAHHWDLAGDSEQALAAYELAIDRAVETLAFARAAQLCARAIELVGNAADVRAQRLSVQRAYALSCAGRSAEAAVLFKEAADRAHGGARTALRCSAAQEIMLSGQASVGMAEARALLVELGIHVPLGVVATLLRSGWDSLVLAFKLRAGRELAAVRTDSPSGRLALDVLEKLTYVLAINPLTMLTVSTQYARFALRYGSAAQAALALTSQAWMMTLKGSLASALPLFERSRRLLTDSATPSMLARQAFTEGSARIAGFDFAGASLCLERAHKLLREHCPDLPWLTTITRYHLCLAWSHLGDHARLATHAELWLAEARERNDALGEALLSGMGNCSLRHLMRDAPEAALEENAQLLARMPAELFSFAHYGLFLAKTYALLYQGGALALRWLESFEPERKRAAIFKTRVARDTTRLFRLSALMHAAVAAAPEERASLLREARRTLRPLERGSSVLQAYASLISAQLDALDGHLPRALEQARTARARYESLGMALRRNALYLEGLLEGGESGRKKRDAALAESAREGWRDPLRYMTASVPLLPLLQANEAGVPSSRGKLLLGRYEVLAALGAGGFGSAVVARDVHTGRKLALKDLVRSSGKPLERFKREFRALQDRHHGNLARLDALLEDEGRWYIAMELVEGSELLSYVRPDGRTDLLRLRAALAGIARGLSALHEVGVVHRDVAPANIRVTAEGRAVLLDFGLIARAGDADDAAPVGSAEYAAPEQLVGAVPDASADVYALGVCLYEALLGRPPFGSGTAAELVARKQAAPRKLGVPKEHAQLYACCLHMLSPNPAARPRMHDVIVALSSESAHTRDRPSQVRASIAPGEEVDQLRFRGRQPELELLAEAFERTCDVGLTLAFVEGESGVGKSALVDEFARRLGSNCPTLHVLHGRCYENEQLAFKAFDGAVDRLAGVLRSLTNPQCEALLPKRAALLAQLFPVLTSVPSIAQASKKGLPADPAAQRLAARECFLELLENLSAHCELLFVVDDLQWADSESFLLLRAMLEQRARLPLLFVITVRPTAELTADAARELAALRALPDSEEIVLEGLSERAASELAAHLYGAPIGEEQLRALVQESKGHPLFLRELIAHQKRGADRGATVTPTLDGALRAHVDALPEPESDLLALAALAGRPLGSHVFALAMQRSELPRDAVIALLTQGLLRRRGANELACYHDRIRQVALHGLAPERRKRLAHALASALEATRAAEPAERARLWDEAEESGHAIEAYEQAGDRALEGLAFTRAEQHYARALELLEAVGPEAYDKPRLCRLCEQRGHALVRAGRSAEAARVYQQAAETAQGETKVKLRMWAAQHLIQSAQVAEGLHAASGLLKELGISLPTSEKAALVRIAWERTRMKLRGTELKPRRGQGAHSERLLLEVLHGLSSPVRAISYLPGSTLVMHYLRRALRAGEPIHAARALAFEGLFRAVSAPKHDQSGLFERSRELAELTGEPALMAEVELMRGLACLTRHEFALAAEHLSNAHELLQTRCLGEPWLLTAARMYLGSAWQYLGDMDALVRHTGEWMEEARARDDRYAQAALTGFGGGSLRHLVRDQPDLAFTEIEQAMAPWPSAPFSTIHYGAFTGIASALSYTRPSELLAWIDGQSQRWDRAYLMRTPIMRGVASIYTSIGIVRALEEARGPRREELLVRAKLQVRVLQQNPTTVAFAPLLRALLQVARGDRSGALSSLTQASSQLSGSTSFWTGTALYLEGLLQGGDAGRAKCEPITARLRADGWVNLERAILHRVPGIRLITEAT